MIFLPGFFTASDSLLVGWFFVHFLIKHATEEDRHANNKNDNSETTETNIGCEQFFPSHDALLSINKTKSLGSCKNCDACLTLNIPDTIHTPTRQGVFNNDLPAARTRIGD